MEKPEETKYTVVITESATIAFYEILEYLYEQYPIDRAEEIAGEIRDMAGSLKHNLKPVRKLPPCLSRTKVTFAREGA